MCPGTSTVLADGFTGGSWSSIQSYIATVTPATGVVTGVIAGTANIIYRDASGCKMSTTVTVNPLPAAIVGNITSCAATTIDTLYDATPGGVWSSGATAIATVNPTTGTVTTLKGGTVVISYTLPLTGCAVSKSFSVDPLPAPVVTYDWVTNTVFTATFYYAYQWYDSLEGLIVGADAYQTAALYDGYYWVVVTDSNGCSAASAYLPYNVSMAGITTQSQTQLHIYPNPSHDVVYIESGVNVRVVISGLDGKTELEQNNAKQVDISKLASGVYFISLYADDGQKLTVQKLIKE